MMKASFPVIHVGNKEKTKTSLALNARFMCRKKLKER